MSISLRLKSALLGGPLDGISQKIRRAAEFGQRYRHPELAELYLESARFQSVLRKLLRPNSSVADIGCHLGSFLNLAKTIAPDGKHLAVEPSLTKSRWLKRKFPAVEIHAIAISDHAGIATFEENTKQSGLSRLSGDTQETGNIYYDVPVKRLDDVLSRHFDLIKLDVEGHELAALRGASVTIERTRPAILFECTSEYEEGRATSRRGIYDLLTKVGYEIHLFGDYLFDKGPLDFREFQRCGLYPFRAMNFIAIP
jgi:FkbM family methyltransferase